MPFHNQESQAVLDQLKVTKNGLSDAEVTERQQQYGLNALPIKPPPGFWYIFLIQFKNPLIYILLAAAVIALLLQEYLDAGFIGLILLITVVIGAVQEWQAEQNAASLQSLLKIMATVRRNGHKVNIESGELVPGDIVLLESGNRVPADMRLIEIQQLKIDESLLTGESDAIEKNIKPVPEHAPLGDRKNMAFAGSTVMAGRGLGVITATGVKTEIGRIGESVIETGTTKPPLIIRLEQLSRHIAVVMLFATAIIAVIAYLQGMGIKDIFFMAVALIVSAIPEGLPIAITIALSIATLRMSKRHVIVRRLSAVEGLGSCTFIASDKTGTLTVNKQTVKKLILPDGATYNVGGEGYNNEGDITGDSFE
ncbi:MAG TPA: HAD-IC family P-type ATPase, partial [Adhaeribacter sp.]|nr:HAD-IC family P-type ATPase [Adhaeribacter sp.]